MINDPQLIGRVEIVYDNGTSRRSFFSGEVSPAHHITYRYIDDQSFNSSGDLRARIVIP